MNIQDLLELLNPISSAEASPMTPQAIGYPQQTAQRLNLENLANNISNDDLWNQHKLYPWVTNNGMQRLLGEIPDTGATSNIDISKIPSNTGIVGSLRELFGLGTPLEDVLNHDKLFEQYPSKRKLPVFTTVAEPSQVMANKHVNYGHLGKLLKSLGVEPAEDSILINTNGRQSGNTIKDTSALLHELGHSIYADAGLYDHNDKSAFGHLTKDQRINKEMSTANSLSAKYPRNSAIYERNVRAQMTPEDGEYLARPTEVASRVIQDRFENNNYAESPLVTMSKLGYPYSTVGWDLSKIDGMRPKKQEVTYMDSLVDRVKELLK